MDEKNIRSVLDAQELACVGQLAFCSLFIFLCSYLLLDLQRRRMPFLGICQVHHRRPVGLAGDSPRRRHQCPGLLELWWRCCGNVVEGLEEDGREGWSQEGVDGKSDTGVWIE